MYRLPSEISGTSEATPLLQDEACAYDPNLYAIGGASEYPDAAIYDAQTDTENIIAVLFSSWLQFLPKWSDNPEHEGHEFFGQGTFNSMSTTWRQIKAGRDILPDSEVIIQRLAEFIFDHMYPLGLRELDGVEVVTPEAFMTHVKDIVAEYWQLILDGIEEDDIDESIKERIGRKIEKLRKFQKRMEELQKSLEHKGREEYESLSREQRLETEFYTENQNSFPSQSLEALADSLEYADSDICDAQTNTDSIIETLFLAWLQFPPERTDDPYHEDYKFFDQGASDAMATAWRQIKAERDVLPDSEVIIQGLAKSIVDYISPLRKGELDGIEDVTTEAFKTHVKDIVSDNWQLILHGIEEEDAEEARKERIRRVKEIKLKIEKRIQRRRETEEVLLFYEAFSRPNTPLPWNCRRVCKFLWRCCSISIFRVPILILLLAWPLSIGIMGGLYMTQCPMSNPMPYVMVTIGAVGTIALLMRLSLICYKSIKGKEIGGMWLWCLLKLMEFFCVDFMGVQLYYFYRKTQSFVSGSSKFCKEIFYTSVQWINYASIALSSVWLFVYFVKGLRFLRRNFFSTDYEI